LKAFPATFYAAFEITAIVNGSVAVVAHLTHLCRSVVAAIVARVNATGRNSSTRIPIFNQASLRATISRYAVFVVALLDTLPESISTH
jgi:hypothetical protein